MARGQQKVVLTKETLPPVSKLSNDLYGYIMRYRILSEDQNRYSHWSPIRELPMPEPLIVSGDVAILGNIIQVVWGDEEGRPNYDVFAKFNNEVSFGLIENNTATLITARPHNFKVGTEVFVSEVSAAFNGIYTITKINSATSFSYKKTSENLIYSPLGGEVFGYFYHGTTPTHQYSFLTEQDATSVQVAIQIESTNKERSSFLTIFESDIEDLVQLS